ncbi:transmembrane signal receptor [Lithospermum erythrorhizon]|uniref:Transmembrane signal receptor n=1 Tax=Lithospermum erythrorhizon TaxID=34254 RepID=A0AAV3QNI1_LITER
MTKEIAALEANGTWVMATLPPNKKALGYVTVTTFLAVVVSRNWELHQMDVHDAFLHGDLDEDVYMKMPPGFYVGRNGMVCKMRKSSYDLRQAPRCWFAKLAASLLSYGFCRSYSDYSLFTIRRGKLELHVLIYVDDLIVAGTDL